jgi:hypothetical protein
MHYTKVVQEHLVHFGVNDRVALLFPMWEICFRKLGVGKTGERP